MRGFFGCNVFTETPKYAKENIINKMVENAAFQGENAAVDLLSSRCFGCLISADMRRSQQDLRLYS